MIERFENRPETRWRFFTDRVMGGVSSGGVDFIAENGRTHAALRGAVSTENNGGFIQIRTELPGGAPPESTGVSLTVRGNDQRYFVHLRTRGTVRPWQFYQAGYDVGADWTEIRLPFSDFRPSGGAAPEVPRAEDLRSIGIVAYGRDHVAQIDIREVGFY